MKKRVLAAAILWASVGAIAGAIAQVAVVPAAPSVPIDFSKHSEQFVQDASSRANAEIELGRIAQQRSKDNDVRQLAAAIVNERSAANEGLKRVALKSKLTVANGVDPQRDAVINALKAKSGQDFEAAYLRHVADDYKETIQFFREESGSADADLATFAKDTLPLLSRHLEMAQRLAQTSEQRQPG